MDLSAAMRAAMSGAPVAVGREESRHVALPLSQAPEPPPVPAGADTRAAGARTLDEVAAPAAPRLGLRLGAARSGGALLRANGAYGGPYTSPAPNPSP